MRLIPVFLLVACTVLTSPSSLPGSWDTIVESEWGIAVNDLEKAGVPRYRIATIQRHNFSWKEYQCVFMCNGVKANGCYNTSGLISWNAQAPNVLSHEIGHGILHKLGYSCWKEYEHTERGCPVT